MRKAQIERITKETQIRAQLEIDGKGRYQISTGIRFFDHMLELFTKHGGFDLELKASGDLDVDQHHTVEDVGIVLGQCFAQALGDRVGINRAGYFVLPMDETLAVVAIDLGGRPALVYHAPTRFRLVGDLQTELLHDFFDGFVNHCGANLHARVMYGRSNHHKVEAIFKCFARALRYACSKDARLKDQLPSTKGLLEKTGRSRKKKP
jgi:imidazoleglycerol-phosphate dehydratase